MDDGRIITFYSYKGGVGRSFELANIAVILARWGSRVLCIDWDLEAPGLHFFFEVEPKLGLLDLLTSVREGKRLHWRKFVRRLEIPGTDGRLTLMAAGRQDERYIPRVQGLNWAGLYRDHDIGAIFEEMREEWTKEFDLVLVDSRTGITDIGAICTAQLPDILAIVFTANQQGLSGVIEVSKRAEGARNHLPYERGKLLILPIPSRFDAREEYDLAESWKNKFTEQLVPFYRTWLHTTVDAKRAIDLCTVPYVSKWSFGERLAVLTEERRSQEFITYSLENIAALLALHFDRTETFGDSPDSYVQLAKRVYERKGQSRSKGDQFLHDVFISYRQDTADIARKIGSELMVRGRTVAWAESSVQPSGSNLNLPIKRTLERSKDLVLLLGNRLGKWQEYETFEFLKQIVEERSSLRSVVTVILGDIDIGSLPTVLAASQMIDGRGKDPMEVAQAIGDWLDRQGKTTQAL